MARSRLDGRVQYLIRLICREFIRKLLLHISCHLILNRSHFIFFLYATGNSQGNPVVLDLQQSHGTRRKQPSRLSRRMDHDCMQGLQNSTSRTTMERRPDAKFPQGTNLDRQLTAFRVYTTLSMYVPDSSLSNCCRASMARGASVSATTIVSSGEKKDRPAISTSFKAS